MSAHAQPAPLVSSCTPALLGGPGAPLPEKCSQHAMALLGEAAGEDMRLASLSIDVTSHPLGDAPVDVTVRIDKRARSIVFASIEARSDARLVYSAQGLFSRAG
jgi:hypothetical protein